MQPVPCEKSIQGIGVLCCPAVIVMEHASQDISSLDRPIPRRASLQRHGTLLINALMGSRMVVVVHVGGQYPLQMALAEDHDPVKAFLANRAHPAFRERIGIRCPHCGVRMIVTSSDVKTVSKVAPNLVSRSWIKKRIGTSPSWIFQLK